jgi:phosphatidylserine/phosphatidylglycerophosphate/cardiolipin synthase-like enzyme
MDMLKNWGDEVGSQASISFQKIGSGKGVLGEVLGVHHQKIYIFDDRVVLSGANLEQNYFLNRRDRGLLIESPELANYLFEYLQILADKPNPEQLLIHYRLWKYAHMPSKYC